MTNKGSSSSSQLANTNSMAPNSRTRNAAHGLTEYNSYGAMPSSNGQQLNKAYDVYSQQVRTQNISSLQQNPNQMRVLNPSSKMFGNLGSLNQQKPGNQSSSALGRQQL